MTSQIFRFKFTDNFIHELNNFAKLHEFDNRIDFKQAWEKWNETNAELVQNEIDILTRLGYEGDIMKKMFVSARYYFRKKGNKNESEQKKRKNYVTVSQNLLISMDKYINENKDLQPKTGFQQFCIEYKDILVEEIKNLYLAGITEPTEIQEKMKKTYNNRYFMLNKK
jgi:hypothetical protein